NMKTKQVIIVSGGNFSDPNNYVRVGSYNPVNKVYTAFDSVRAKSTRSVLIDGKYAYVTADTLMLKYDIDNYTRVAIDTTSGLNTPGGYLAQYGNYILATRGFGTKGNYLTAYNKSDLKQAFNIAGIADQASGIVVVGDTAYVGVAGAYNKDSGSIAVINLKTMQFKREIMLDSMGAQINRIFTDGTNIYTVNTKRNIITTYNITTGSLHHHSYSTSQYGNGNGVEFNRNKIYTDFSFLGIGAFDVTTNNTSSSMAIDYNKIPGFNTFSNYISGAALDTLNQQFYITATNFVNTGETYVFNMNGDILDTFNVGVSSEAIAMDYRSTVSISNPQNQLINISAYPNPAKNTLTISTKGLNNASVQIIDLGGKTVLFQNLETAVQTFNIQQLPAGMYIFNLKSDEGFGVKKFIKQ
ncbi:MAG: T9SS type A sorting domain-containing protein, partial [Sphingobacteriaceae bacterium]